MPATRKTGLRKRAQLSSEDSEPESLHSDALDNPPPKKHTCSSNSKYKSSSPSKPKPKPRKCKAKEDDAKDEEDVDGSDLDLKEGQQVNTLDFLMQLKDPACNDREWFKLHGIWGFCIRLKLCAYFNNRTCVSSRRKGVQGLQDRGVYQMLTEVDTQIPPLPPKDSVIAAGAWCPAKNELATLRNHLLCSTPTAKTLRTILSSETFTTHFSPPHPHPHGERQNVFGHEDQLKVAPKRADKNHKDIALLKCRSLAVSCRFTDAQVIAPGAEFMDALHGVADVMMPFVHCLNDMMTLPADDGSDGENEEDESDDVVE
ncbi:hypothetical protein F4604DRAFT_1885591 [Suillus subluteus]|nr:hypothetical protein F4604DRAFT_1885591 [Suillus subluteus]